MGSTTQMDFAGLDLVVNKIRVGASAPGTTGTELAGTELTVLDGITAGTATASKAVVLGASKEIATITTATITNLTSTAATITTVTPTTIAGGTFSVTPVLGTGTTIDLASTTGTFVSNAVTITENFAVLTSESLSTAHTASQALVVTKSGVAAGDIAMVTRAGGTNTGGVPNITSVVCSTNTVTINLKNEALATNAFNGTFIFNLMIFKA